MHLPSSPALLVNARLVGVEGSFSVLISDSHVVSITPSSSSPPLLPAGGELVDLHSSSFVGPSLIDSHVHFTAWTLNLQRLDTSSATSAHAVAEIVRIRAALPTDDPLELIVGRDYRVGRWPDIEEMTAQLLDGVVAPGRPVAIISGDLHAVWCNSAALEMLGFDKTRAGVLREKDAFDATGKLNDISDEELDEQIADAGRQAAARGVTKIVEFEMKHNLSTWTRRVRDRGFRSLRVHCGMYEDHINDAVSAGLKSGDEVPGGLGLLTVGPYKIITDGSLGTRTAYCHAPYPDTEDYGLWIYPNKTLREMATFATTHNFTLAVHGIGDKANSLVLETFAALDPPPLAGSSIEHAQLLSWSDLPLFKSLNLVASVQPEHLNDDKELADRFWAGRTERAFAYQTLLDAGIPLVLGSDAPVAPLEPWGAMAAAISRERAGEEETGAWHPEQRISKLAAYEASTGGRARIVVGDVADLCITKRDPLDPTVGAKELRGMEVVGTMLGGNWTHNAL